MELAPIRRLMDLPNPAGPDVVPRASLATSESVGLAIETPAGTSS